MVRTVIVENAKRSSPAPDIEVDTDGDGMSDARSSCWARTPLRGYGRRRLLRFFEVESRARRSTRWCRRSDAARLTRQNVPSTCSATPMGTASSTAKSIELGTDPELVDTDADGIPDGIEYRRGLDPTRDDTQEDLDFDGITNLDEVLNFSSPTMPDTRARAAWAIHSVTQQQSTNADGSVCYSFIPKGSRSHHRCRASRAARRWGGAIPCYGWARRPRATSATMAASGWPACARAGWRLTCACRSRPRCNSRTATSRIRRCSTPTPTARGPRREAARRRPARRGPRLLHRRLPRSSAAATSGTTATTVNVSGSFCTEDPRP